MLRSLRVGGALLPVILLSAYSAPAPLPSVHAASASCESKQVARVSAVQEGVRVKHARRWSDAKKGTKVFAGDTVETKKGQRAALAVCGGGKVYVNQESTAVMSSPKKMQAKKGEVAEHSAKSGTQEIKTRDAVARSHGAYFDVSVKSKQSVFTVASGTASVQNDHGKVSITTNHQSAVTANAKPAPPKAVDAQRVVNWAAPLAETWKILTSTGTLDGPYRIALDSQGNIFTTDDPTSGRRVVKLSPTGQILTQWKLQGTVTEPIGIAVDAQNNVYVTDSIGNNVQKFTDDGQPLATYDLQQLGPERTISPTGIALDPQGNMYVVGEFLEGIEKLSPTGQLLAFWGGTEGTGPLQFGDPQDIALDPQGNIYIADHFNDRVQKLSPSGQFLLQWSVTKNQSPEGVGVDRQGNIYVAMSTEVDEYDSSGHTLRSWKNDDIHHSLTDPGMFDRAFDVAPDAKGNLFVADHYNNRIQELVRSP